jgi:hypothetical protein
VPVIRDLTDFSQEKRGGAHGLLSVKLGRFQRIGGYYRRAPPGVNKKIGSFLAFFHNSLEFRAIAYITERAVIEFLVNIQELAASRRLLYPPVK